MPIMLTRKDGPPTPFRNAEYIPFYYFIPKSILSRCGAELNAIPRNPQELFHNRAACEFVESDLFRLLIIDATAFMVWPYMGFGEYMEIYSGYDPAWRFAHCPDYWIQELTDEGILASAGELFKGCHSELGYVPEWQIDIYLRYIVPNVMKSTGRMRSSKWRGNILVSRTSTFGKATRKRTSSENGTIPAPSTR